MRVELLDHVTAADEDIAAWHACAVVAYHDLWPDEPTPPLGYHTDQVRNPGDLRPFRVFAAWDDAHKQILGAAETRWWDGANSHRVYTDIYVLPNHRRRGIGRALLDAVVAAARAEGRTSLLGGARYDNGGVEFAKAIGARFGLDQFRSRLILPEANLQPVTVPGFSTVRWADRCPAEWLESFCRVQEVMNSAPQGGDIVWKDDSWDAERVRRAEDDLRAKGMRRYTVCAVDDDSGELVALTQVEVADTWLAVGEQDDTGVLAAYRGRGLAKLVKAEMAAWLQADRPELRLLSTWNACENVAMLAVNAALGYGNRERWLEAEVVIR